MSQAPKQAAKAKPSSIKSSTTIAIVGAGLMGRLIALALHRQGYAITLIDKDNKAAHQSAAYAAAGLLAPLGESLHCEANIVEMGFESLKLWPTLLESLDEYTFFQQEGTIMVSHEQDQGDYLRFSRHLQQHYAQHTAQHINRQQLEQLEPEIGRSFKQALFLPDEGQVGNRKLLIALQRQLEKEKVTWLSECNVVAITESIEEKCDEENKPASQSHVVQSHVVHSHIVQYQIKHHSNTAQPIQSIQEKKFDLVIDCRGTGAKTKPVKNSTQATQANPLTDLRAVRGELFQLFAPNVNISRPIRLMHPRYQLYIAPKGKGFYVVGATEIESDDTSPMTVRSAMELLSAAYSVHPGFAEANIRQQISQLRPAFSDNQPKIFHQTGLIQVNGLYRHGFLIAPVVLAQVCDLVNTITCSTKCSTKTTTDKPFVYSHWLPITYLSSVNTNALTY